MPSDMTPEKIKAFCAYYKKDGVTIRMLARAHGMGEEKARRIIRQHGEVKNGAHRPAEIPPATLRAIRNAYANSDVTVKTICVMFGMGGDRIREILVSAGVQLRGSNFSVLHRKHTRARRSIGDVFVGGGAMKRDNSPIELAKTKLRQRGCIVF